MKSPSAGRPLSTELYVLILLTVLGLFACAQLGALNKAYWEYDEGLNVIKAQLVAEGHWPHREIWSDQPPLFTLLLRLFFGLFGWSIPVGRAFLVLWATLLLIAVARATEQLAGRRTALLATLLLALSPMVQELGRTILIGLPAIALGTMSLAVAFRSMKRAGLGGYVLAGALFGLGMLTKPLIAPYYVALLLSTLWPNGEGSVRSRVAKDWWRRAVALNAAPAVLLAVTLALFGPREFLGQVLGTFTEARGAYGFSLRENLVVVLDSFGSGYYPGLFLSALLGLVMLGRRERSLCILMAGWLLASVAAVLLHTPQRWHEHLLLLPPACLLAAVLVRNTVEPLLRATSQRRTCVWRLSWVCIALLALGMPATARKSLRDWQQPLRTGSKAVNTQLALDRLRTEVRPGSTIITDDPMLAFVSGNTVPPLLAVPSLRRIRTGSISAAELIRLGNDSSIGAVVFWEQRLYHLTEFYEWARTHMALCAMREKRWFFVPCDPMWPQVARSATGLELVGSSVSALGVDPGEDLTVRLYWRAARDIPERYTLFVHLVDAKGRSWGQQDILPFKATDSWVADDIVVESVLLRVADDAPPGPKYLSVGWYDAEKHRVSFTDADGHDLPGGQITLAAQPVVRWAPELQAPTPEQRLEADLGGIARLLGYDWAIADADGQGQADLTLYWQALGETNNRYKVFVHLTDADDTVIAQSDAEPASGERPTAGWRSGEYIRDAHRIPLPAEPSDFQVYVGLYDAVTLARLPVTLSGTALPNGRVPLQLTEPTDAP